MPAGQPFTYLCKQMARPPQAGRADLHLHTTASDGTYTPTQIVDLACRSGLSALAITDHDVLEGVAPARTAAAGRLEVIAGVEASTEFHGQELHLLGFFIRLDHGPLVAALEKLRRNRLGRFQEMVARLRTMGVPLEEETFAGVNGTVAIGRRHLAEMLVKAGRAGSVREAFQRWLGDRGQVAVPKSRLPVAEAIALIRGAGGVASWAHPTYDCTEETLRELRGFGMQAVETDFPSCRQSRGRELRGLASRLGLAITGGSDCHGPGALRRTVGACGLSAVELEQLRARATGTA